MQNIGADVKNDFNDGYVFWKRNGDYNESLLEDAHAPRAHDKYCARL